MSPRLPDLLQFDCDVEVVIYSTISLSDGHVPDYLTCDRREARSLVLVSFWDPIQVRLNFQCLFLRIGPARYCERKKQLSEFYAPSPPSNNNTLLTSL